MNWRIIAFPLAHTELTPRTQQKLSTFLSKDNSKLLSEATAFLQEKAAFLERKENWGALFKCGSAPRDSPEILCEFWETKCLKTSLWFKRYWNTRTENSLGNTLT